MVNSLIFVTPALSGGGIEFSTPILIDSLRQMTSQNIQWIGINTSQYTGNLTDVSIVSGGRESGDGLIKTLRILLNLRSQILKEPNPLVVISGEVAEILASTLPKQIPLICVEHASHPWKMNLPLGFLIRQKLSRSAKAWVTVNSSQHEIWPGIDKFQFIANPVTPIPINEQDQGVGIIHMGRITSDKGPLIPCEVAELEGIDLDLYGEGELLLQLRERFSRCPNIKFHGFIEEAWRSLGVHRLLISASRHEGDGRIIAEAILRRQPILLLDTVDHRRFGLPELNYFYDLGSLTERIKAHRGDGFSRLRPPSELANLELEARNPQVVAKAWDSLLKLVSTH